MVYQEIMKKKKKKNTTEERAHESKTKCFTRHTSLDDDKTCNI